MSNTKNSAVRNLNDTPDGVKALILHIEALTAAQELHESLANIAIGSEHGLPDEPLPTHEEIKQWAEQATQILTSLKSLRNYL